MKCGAGVTCRSPKGSTSHFDNSLPRTRPFRTAPTRPFPRRSPSRCGPRQVAGGAARQHAQVVQDKALRPEEDVRNGEGPSPIRKDVVDGGLVGAVGVLRRAGCADVLENARRVQRARGAEVDVLLGGEDTLVGARDGQVGPLRIVLDVVRAVVAKETRAAAGPGPPDTPP